MLRPLSRLPGPAGLPLLGSIGAIAGDPLAFMTHAASFGGLVHFRIGRQSTLLVSDPALIEAVLVEHRSVTQKDPVTASLGQLLGQGLLTAEGEVWRKNRRLVAPSFQPQHIAALGDVMVASTAEHVAPIGDGPRDVHPDMMALTLDIAVRTLFGTVLDDAAAVGPLVESLMHGFNQRVHTWRRLLPAWVPTQARRDAAHTRAELHRILLDIIARRRAAGTGDDLLGRLLAARDDDGQGFDDAQLLDEVLTLFLAGHETTALTLGYTLWLLGEHPAVQARIHDELATLGDAPLTAADTRRLPYLGAVIKESMRLYPPAWIIGRQATEEFVLGDVSVPKGTVLLISQWVVHRDAHLYPEPTTFRPERWLDGTERPKFAYLPFGGGPRVCVGDHFARMEATLALGTWLRRFEVTSVGGPAPALLPSVTLRPKDGLRVGLRRRGAVRAAA